MSRTFLLITSLICILTSRPTQTVGQPPSSQPQFEPKYRTVARWTGTIEMRIHTYATREPGGAFGTALSEPNSMEDSNTQITFREEVDPIDGEERIVLESLTWSSTVGDLYYQNKDGSRVAAGEGGSGGGSLSESDLAGELLPPSASTVANVERIQHEIREVETEIARLENDLEKARERARAFDEQATPEERAAAARVQAALEGYLRVQNTRHDKEINTARDAWSRAERELSERVKGRLNRESDAYIAEVERIHKQMQSMASADQKRLEAENKIQQLQQEFLERHGKLTDGMYAAVRVRSGTEEIKSLRIRLHSLRKHIWHEQNRRARPASVKLSYTRDPQTGQPSEVELDFGTHGTGREKDVMHFEVKILPLELKGFDVFIAPEPKTVWWLSSARIAQVRGPVSQDGRVTLREQEDSRKGEPGLIGGGEPKVNIVFTREPEPEPIELVIIPQGYDYWVPQGGEDVDTPGNGITIDVKLQTPEGGPPPVAAKRIRFELVDVSEEPGVAINWPPKTEKLDGADLRFDQTINANLYVTHVRGIRAQTPEGEQVTQTSAIISAHDFGAFAKLRVHADLVDGRHVEGYLVGEPNRNLVLLPKRKDDSRIAESWRQGVGAAQLTDDDDGESASANDKQPGDGLSVYEEYRGYFENGEHRRANPQRKDLFIRDEIGDSRTLGGIGLFMISTDLDVHWELRRHEFDFSRVINTNHKSAHRVEQHGLLLKKERTGARWLGGEAVGGPGNPAKTQMIRIAPGQGGWWSSAARKRNYAALIAHELLHGVNVWHHGDNDIGRVQWKRGKDGAGNEIIFETELDDRGHATGSSQIVRVFAENGTEHQPSRFRVPVKAWVGSQRGQHSGHDHCLMRYDCAQAYDSGLTALVPQRYWLAGPSEPTGFDLCTSPNGTGVNASWHQPRPRYGKAGQDRGDCMGQVHVSDEFPAVTR